MYARNCCAVVQFLLLNAEVSTIILGDMFLFSKVMSLTVPIVDLALNQAIDSDNNEDN